MSRQTKAELLLEIERMKLATVEPAEDVLVRAIAGLISDTGAAVQIKHMFYRKGPDFTQISLDMHE
jgi:hypothetical protein